MNINIASSSFIPANRIVQNRNTGIQSFRGTKDNDGDRVEIKKFVPEAHSSLLSAEELETITGAHKETQSRSEEKVGKSSEPSIKIIAEPLMTMEQAEKRAEELRSIFNMGDNDATALKLRGLDRFKKIFEEKSIPEGCEKVFLKPDQLKLFDDSIGRRSGNYYYVRPEDYHKRIENVKNWYDPKESSVFGDNLSSIIYDNLNGLVDKNGSIIDLPSRKPKYTKAQCDMLASQFMIKLGDSMLDTAKEIGKSENNPKEAYKVAKLAYKCLDGAEFLRYRAGDKSRSYEEIPYPIYPITLGDIHSTKDAIREYENSYGDFPVGSEKFEIFYNDKLETDDPVELNWIIKQCADNSKDLSAEKFSPEKKRRIFFGWVKDINPPPVELMTNTVYKHRLAKDAETANEACEAVAPYIPSLPPDERFFGFTEVLNKITMGVDDSDHHATLKLYSVLDSIPEEQRQGAKELLMKKDTKLDCLD